MLYACIKRFDVMFLGKTCGEIKGPNNSNVKRWNMMNNEKKIHCVTLAQWRIQKEIAVGSEQIR
jgi:hypothetical protein